MFMFNLNVIDIYLNDHDAVKLKFICHFNMYDNVLIVFDKKKDSVKMS